MLEIPLRHLDAPAIALHYEQMPDCRFEGISIEVPALLLTDLLADAGKNGNDFSRDTTLNMVTLNSGHRCHQHGLQVAHAILNLNSDSVIERMRVEAAALDLIAEICTGNVFSYLSGKPCLPYQHRMAVDEAVGILESEFHEAHTITSLSHRVQLNECYLKSAFRKITGSTIAKYLRKQRMSHAQCLIERQQSTVLEAALSVGYSNPSHFTAAFRSVYGISPSDLKQNFM